MRIGIEGTGRWLWEFPGSERELWGEWADRFAPLHLDPTWSSQPREYLGTVTPVDALPDDVDGRIDLGRRPRLWVGTSSAYAGQKRKKGIPDHPVFGPLEDHTALCPHEVEGGSLVSLQLNGALKRKIAKAALAHPCLRSLHTLELAKIRRLTPDATLAALTEGGPLPQLRRFRWAGDLEASQWKVLEPLMPNLEELSVTSPSSIRFPPPAVRRVRASWVGAQATEQAPADLTIWDFDASGEPGWWHHVETLRIEKMPSRRHTLCGLARLGPPTRLRALVLTEPAPLDILAPAVVELFDAWSGLQLLTVGTTMVARPQVEALRSKPDLIPDWTPEHIRGVLATLGGTLRGPLGEGRVVEVEEELGVELPAEYRRFVRAFGDGGAGPGQGGLTSVLDPDTRGGRTHLPFDPTTKRNRLDGTLRLCDHGCGMSSLLVLSGPDAGTVWFDDNGDISPHEVPNGCELSFEDWFLDWLELALRSALGS